MAEEDNINNNKIESATASMKHLLLSTPAEELEVKNAVAAAAPAPASMGRTKLTYRKSMKYQHARILPPDEAPAAAAAEPAPASMNLLWQGKMSYQEFWHSEHPTIFKNTCLEIVRRG